jgi:hypothetical protein
MATRSATTSTPSPTAPTASGSSSTIARGPEPTPPNAHALLQQIERLHEQLRGAVVDAITAKAPGLQLPPAACRELEETLGIGTTRSVAEFVRAVERLASIKVGEVRIAFTPGQLGELAHRAQKRGRTVEAEMKAVVSRIEDELFYKAAG